MAAARYESALSISAQLFDAALADTSACWVAPMTDNIAAHNLAELSRIKNDTEAASGYLELAIEKLVTVAEDSSMPLALRVSCSRHLPRAIAHVEQICPEARRHAAVRRLIARAWAARDKLSRCVRGALGQSQERSRGQVMH